jgi:hypothetical protein
MMQGLVSTQEGVLHHVLGVIGVPEQAEHRVVEPILVAADQFAEGDPVAADALRNQEYIVPLHGRPTYLTDGETQKFPDWDGS